MNNKLGYQSMPLHLIVDQLSKDSQGVIIDGNTLTISDILNVARKDVSASFTANKAIIKRINETFKHMMKDVENGVPVYGCNTGYGAQASVVVNGGTKAEKLKSAINLSEGIVHTDITVGPEFENDVIRAAMLIRINMLMKGVSGVSLKTLDKYLQLLNSNYTPIVNQYGGVGASGDLHHNSRVLSVLRQLPGTFVKNKNGQKIKSSEALSSIGLSPLKLDPKAGLGLVNGDNFSTAVAALIAYDTASLLLISQVLSAMVVEVLKGSDRAFHPLLSHIRPHEGQKEVSSVFRYLLKGSKLAYQEMSGHKARNQGVKVQDGYSLRCISQYHGVNFERIKQILDVITINANSASDNPLWVHPDLKLNTNDDWQWVSGGNFIAMHMVESIDSIRKMLTQIVKLNDRQLARIVNPHENNGLGANLSSKNAISQCTFKGVQVQAGMLDIYSTLLSMPVSTMFGVHEEMNQDITSHALTSGILGLENLRLARYSVAQNFVAVAQAVDLRGGKDLLSPKTRPIYEFLRNKIDFVDKERPLNNDIEVVYADLVTGKILNLVLEIFKEI
jgi:histidine ammonia-lyase